MFNRIRELFKPIIGGHEGNYETVDQLPVDNSNGENDQDASNPSRKGE